MSKDLFVQNSKTGKYWFPRRLNAEEVLRSASMILDGKLKSGDCYTDSKTVKEYLRVEIGMEEREIFLVLFLDNQHQLLKSERLFLGTVSSAVVHPREVVKTALKHNASAVIVAHNHPSGIAEPSQADRRITEQIRQALELVEIRLLDHFIVGSTEVVSFAEMGLI